MGLMGDSSRIWVRVSCPFLPLLSWSFSSATTAPLCLVPTFCLVVRRFQPPLLGSKRRSGQPSFACSAPLSLVSQNQGSGLSILQFLIQTPYRHVTSLSAATDAHQPLRRTPSLPVSLPAGQGLEGLGFRVPAKEKKSREWGSRSGGQANGRKRSPPLFIFFIS